MLVAGLSAHKGPGREGQWEALFPCITLTPGGHKLCTPLSLRAIWPEPAGFQRPTHFLLSLIPLCRVPVLHERVQGATCAALGPEHDVHFYSQWSVELLSQGQGIFCRACINLCIAEPHPSTTLTHEDILEWVWRRRQGGWYWALIEKLSLGKVAPRPPARSQPTARL